mmetsp:Transcript_18419/g.36820  ORF Transcript_18419/g.36820 Transcript_18419/m.36820 type:complete len:126 (+) Transcript_18419:269-646(+)
MESFVPYGIFTESGPTSLLQYYTSASEVSTPNDWFAVQDDLKVVAVVRFDGSPSTVPLNVTVFDSEGSALGVTECVGACNVKVPMEARAYAAVQYKEMKPGTFDGEEYEYVDHCATTTAIIEREN